MKSIPKKIFYFFQIIRPLNVLMVGISVFFGAWIAGFPGFNVNFVLAMVSAMFICAGGNTHNDYCDLNTDSVNKPYKVLPAGKITPNEAYVLWIITSIAGIILSIRIGYIHFCIATTTGILLYLYNIRLKNTIFWGNFTVSIITGLAFIYGGFISSDKKIAFVPAIFSLFFHFGREVVKDLEDKYGDSVSGINTLATRYHFTIPFLFIFFSFIFLVISTIIPYLYLGFSLTYLIIVVVGVDVILLLLLIILFLDRTKRNLNRVSMILKADMFIGFIALYFR